MKRVFFVSYSTHAQGLELIEGIAMRVDAEPAYWIGGLPEFKNDVLAKFPGVTYQRQIESNVSGPPDQLLDPKSQIEYVIGGIAFEKMALTLMDRFLEDIQIHSYQDKLTHLYWLVDKYARLLKKMMPQFCYFGELPHSLGTFILYSLCREMGVRTVISGYAYFPDRARYINKLEEIGNGKWASQSIALSPESAVEIDKIVSKFQSNYDAAKPSYMHKKRHYNPLYIIPRLDIFKEKRILRRVYNSLAVKQAPDGPYVYVALHYQPEATTAPMGNIFHNQWLLTKLISDNLPAGWKIAVKEHPSQWAYTKRNQRHFRSKYFYQSIASIKNVIMMPVEYNSFTLLDGSRIVATVSGTISLEAILRKKNCMLFGLSPYSGYDGITIVKDNETCSAAFGKAMNDVLPDIEKIRLSFRKDFDTSLPYIVANDINTFDVARHVEKILDILQ